MQWCRTNQMKCSISVVRRADLHVYTLSSEQDNFDFVKTDETDVTYTATEDVGITISW